MPGKLADDLILKQVDDRVQIFRLLLRRRRQSARFDSNFTVLPVFVNREYHLCLACPLEELPHFREFALRIAAPATARVAVPTRNPRRASLGGVAVASAVAASFLRDPPFDLSSGLLRGSPSVLRPISVPIAPLRLAHAWLRRACRSLAPVRPAILICLAPSISAIAWS